MIAAIHVIELLIPIGIILKTTSTPLSSVINLSNSFLNASYTDSIAETMIIIILNLSYHFL